MRVALKPRGRAKSEPLRLSVVTKPARLAPAEEETMNLQFARYYQAGNDLEKALQAIQKALKANSNSIFAHILVPKAEIPTAELMSSTRFIVG
jgi:hypothetical protein